MSRVVTNASAVSPTLHQTMTGSAADVSTSPVVTRPTRMNVTAVALCMSAPKSTPTRLASGREWIVRCTSAPKLGPASWRSAIPISWMPRKKRPRPRTSVFGVGAGMRRWIPHTTAMSAQPRPGERRLPIGGEEPTKVRLRTLCHPGAQKSL
jgi:hypothetical protein